LASRLTVTVGLPFWNARHTLADAVRSVFAQTHADWELLLVDDGSTDGSLELATWIRDPRVKVHSDGQNRGLSWRLNQIADWAGGEYLARLDADDLMHPGRLHRQLRFFDCHPDTDLVCTAMAIIDSSGQPVGMRSVGEESFHPRAALERSILTHATILGRVEWFRRHRYDPSYHRAEDQELWFRTVRTSRFRVLGEPLYLCRDYGSPAFAKYRSSCRCSRRLFRQHGPETVGWSRTVGLLATSWAKQEVYRLCSLLGKDVWIAARRNRRLLPAESEKLAAAVEVVRNTEVPGLRWEIETGGLRR